MLRRLASERGIALPMALGVMFVLTISTVTILAFTGASARDSAIDRSGQDAKALAESGFNRAASLLWQNSQPIQSNPMAPVALPVCAASCVSGLPSGQNVTWTTVLESGSGTSRIWRITGQGTVPNPSGPGGSPITRTVSGKFKVGTVVDLQAWKGLYAAAQDEDCFMQNKSVVETPVYIRAIPGMRMCIKDTGTMYLGPSLVVYGAWLDVISPASVGRPSPLFNVPEVKVTGGCSSGGAACDPARQVWTSSYSNAAPDIPKLQVTPSWNYWRDYAKPGPAFPCTSGTGPSFTSTSWVTLMPGSSYDCIYDNPTGLPYEGQLKWDAANRELTVHGTMYFNGNLDLNGVHGNVKGQATIYVAGDDGILMQNKGSLCGIRRSYNDLDLPFCDSAWDPGATNADFLMLIAKSPKSEAIDMKGHFDFQGGLYAEGGYMLQNDARFKGPIIANKVQLKNDTVIDAWTPLNDLPPGAPGTKLGLQLVEGSWSG